MKHTSLLLVLAGAATLAAMAGPSPNARLSPAEPARSALALEPHVHSHGPGSASSDPHAGLYASDDPHAGGDPHAGLYASDDPHAGGDPHAGLYASDDPHSVNPHAAEPHAPAPHADNPHAPDPHGARASSAPVSVSAVERSRAANGHTVAEVFAQRAPLAGQRISVRGTVVKATDGVLGKTYLHLQDGSGSAQLENHDLTATTTESFELGETVEVEGVLAIDQDVGLDYRYPALLADVKRVR